MNRDPAAALHATMARMSGQLGAYLTVPTPLSMGETDRLIEQWSRAAPHRQPLIVLPPGGAVSQPPTPRQVEELQLLMAQLTAMGEAAAEVREEMATHHAERSHSPRLGVSADAARMERWTTEIAQIEEHEREVRAELLAAHERATEAARAQRLAEPLDPMAAAQRELHAARDDERAARAAVQRAYARPGELHRIRRRILLADAGAVAVLLVLAVLLGAFTPWVSVPAIMIIVPVVMVAVAVVQVRRISADIESVRSAIPPAIERHETALATLVTAEAGVMALGGRTTD